MGDLWVALPIVKLIQCFGSLYGTNSFEMQILGISPGIDEHQSTPKELRNKLRLSAATVNQVPFKFSGLRGMSGLINWGILIKFIINFLLDKASQIGTPNKDLLKEMTS